MNDRSNDASNDRWLEDTLRSSLRPRSTGAPSFGQVFAAAEAEIGRQRRTLRIGAGIVAVAAAVIVGIALRPAAPTDEFLIQESLLTGTQWRAPSDALLPDHPFDIYQETRWTVPDWPSSTVFEEGTLL